MNLNQRKHRSQMTKAEINGLEAIVHSVNSWSNLDNSFSALHLRNRMNQRKVSLFEIQETLRKGEVIEVHKNFYPEIRAVVRKQFGIHCICVVVSLSKQKVITVYVNLASDNHSTLDYSQYLWNGDLFKEIKLPKALYATARA